MVNPVIGARRFADGKINLAEVIEEVRRRQPPEVRPPDPNSSLPRVLLQHIKVSGATVNVEDQARAKPLKMAFGPSVFELSEISTIPKRQGTKEISIGLPGSGTVRATGNVTVQPLGIEGDVRLEELHLKDLWPLLEPYFQVTVTGGELTGRFHYTVAAADGIGPCPRHRFRERPEKPDRRERGREGSRGPGRHDHERELPLARSRARRGEAAGRAAERAGRAGRRREDELRADGPPADPGGGGPDVPGDREGRALDRRGRPLRGRRFERPLRGPHLQPARDVRRGRHPVCDHGLHDPPGRGLRRRVLVVASQGRDGEIERQGQHEARSIRNGLRARRPRPDRRAALPGPPLSIRASLRTGGLEGKGRGRYRPEEGLLGEVRRRSGGPDDGAEGDGHGLDAPEVGRRAGPGRRGRIRPHGRRGQVGRHSRRENRPRHVGERRAQRFRGQETAGRETRRRIRSRLAHRRRRRRRRGRHKGTRSRSASIRSFSPTVPSP